MTDLLSINHPNLIPQNNADKGGKIQGNLKPRTTFCTPLQRKGEKKETKIPIWTETATVA